MPRTARNGDLLDEALESEVVRAGALNLPDSAFAEHGATHPLGAGFGGAQDIMPQRWDEPTALSYAKGVPPSVVKHLGLIGTPDEVVEKAAEWRDCGVRHLVLLVATDGKDGYHVTVGSLGGRPVTTGTGLTLAAEPLPQPDTALDTLVLPGGSGTQTAVADTELIAWVRAAAPHARRVVTAAPAPSSPQRPVCSTVAPPPPTGPTPMPSPSDTPPSPSTRTPSSSAAPHGCGRPPASPPASTSRSHSSRTTTAPRPRRPSPGDW